MGPRSVDRCGIHGVLRNGASVPPIGFAHRRGCDQLIAELASQTTRMSDPRYARLQWGRDLLIAEFERRDAERAYASGWASMGPRSADRGIAALTRIRSVPSPGALQLMGRDQLIAELPGRSAQNPHGSGRASMGPRSADRELCEPRAARLSRRLRFNGAAIG